MHQSGDSFGLSSSSASSKYSPRSREGRGKSRPIFYLSGGSQTSPFLIFYSIFSLFYQPGGSQAPPFIIFSVFYLSGGSQTSPSIIFYSIFSMFYLPGGSQAPPFFIFSFYYFYNYNIFSLFYLSGGSQTPPFFMFFNIFSLFYLPGGSQASPFFSTTTKSSHYSNCLEESSHPPSTTPSQQSHLCPTTFSFSTSSPSSLTSITSPVKYPSLDIRLIADPVVEEPLQEENREISTLIRLLSDFSRQGPGGQLNPSFISLPFCILCDLGAKCQGPYCQGLKKPKSQKLMTRMPPVSDSIPGLQFLPRLANEPVQTPRSRLSLRKIKCLTPSIFRSKKMGKSSSIPIKTSSHQVKVKTMMEKPVTKAPPVSPRIEQPNLRWLQLFLMNCGQNKKRKSMQSKSSPIKSSLERKLEVSELSCKRNPPLKSSSGSQNLKAEVQLVKSSDRLVLFFFYQ